MLSISQKTQYFINFQQKIKKGYFSNKIIRTKRKRNLLSFIELSKSWI